MIDDCNISDFRPNKSSWDSEKLDKRSVLLVENILLDCPVSCDLQQGGTKPNIDGYIDLLDEDDRICGKLTVQIKHLTTKEDKAKYDIPQYILGYAKRIKGEVVIFMACDTDNEVVYWKYIDTNFIEVCKNKAAYIQGTYVYHFSPEESFTKVDVLESVKIWKKIYEEKSLLIIDNKKRCEEYVSLHKQAFHNTNTKFFNLRDSHIERKETELLLDWVKGDLKKEEPNVKLLVGKAGVGKSVVIRNFINRLDEEGIKCLAIKADRTNITNDETNGFSLQSLQQTIDWLSAEQKKVVLIIDQIDALSQYLSNDRSKLSNLLNIVNTLRENQLKDVRIVVSCREYDLEYDTDLKLLKEKSSFIKLGELSVDDVKGIVSKLDKTLPSKMSAQTLKILRIPQHLDIFCRIYKPDNCQYNYTSHIDLYDGLWCHVLDNASDNIKAIDIEKSLYKIAETVKEADTLNPRWIADAEETPLLAYLASKGVILWDGKGVSFFHQSFYDYVLARDYVSKDHSFFSELENKFQGLEVRSTAKLLLDFERAYSDKLYKQELETILFSDKIRGHIKQLALSVLAYNDDPRGYEKKIVRRLYDYDQRLFAFFIAHASSEQWYTTVECLATPIFPELTLNSELYISVANFSFNYAFSHANEIFDLIGSIKDKETQHRLVEWILHGHNDYSSKFVRDWYYRIKARGHQNLSHFVRDSIESNLSFALLETESLINELLETEDKHKREHGDYTLTEDVCKTLYDKYPKDFLQLLYQCFVKIVKTNSQQKSIWGYSNNHIFNSRHHDSEGKLFEWLKDLLARYTATEPDFVKPLILELLQLNDEMSLVLAFNTMSANPNAFDSEIWSIVSDNSRMDQYMNYGEFNYYFLEMLKKWCLTLDREKSEKYQNIICDFKSGEDVLTDKDRKFHNTIYPYLGYKKWKLLCTTISPQDLLPFSKRIKQELVRRFKHEYKNEKPNHGIPMAHVCGGIVSQEQYKKFSKKTWLSAFHVEDSRSGKFRPFDDRVQAEAFKVCVEESPSYFKPFVVEMFEDDNVSDLYRFNGLLGLLSSGWDKTELLPLFRRFLSCDYIANNPHNFEQLAKFYVKEEGTVLDKMIPILVEVIKQPFQPRVSHTDHGHDRLTQIVNNMLTDAINSPQGIALQTLIEICAVPQKRAQIYHLLKTIQADLAEELKLQIIRYISASEYYDEELFDELYPILISNMGPSALLINTHAIQYYYYKEECDFMNQYVERVIEDEDSHILLAQIFFYGTTRQEVSTKCFINLERVLSCNNDSAIKEIIEVCMKNLEIPELQALSTDILKRFAKDEREKVISTYQLYCSKMPVNCFNLFLELSANWKTKEYNGMRSQLEYIEKCIPKYPVECYRFIRDNDYWQSKESLYFIDEKVKILLKIYKKLGSEEENESMNELMDIFDKLILTNSKEVNKALEEMDNSKLYNTFSQTP